MVNTFEEFKEDGNMYLPGQSGPFSLNYFDDFEDTVKKKQKKEDKSMMSESKKKKESIGLGGSANHKDHGTRDTLSFGADKATVYSSYKQYQTLGGFSEILTDSNKSLTLYERNLLCQMLLAFDIPLY